ncbi:SDR family oxidoreductase [Desulfatitalea alkaliphila]|uniref:dTDP-4-dehydrorhamnose reductase n=1 Tax=Desulfatitalea alkaliphila TaxID=2929485 RepID=A0AA41R1N1_9BACT|nr:sugar nucleotide-binding protein [Desulfatitalea alkaliphila]MCJ8499130.1 sugar nucleotide-binding protein [Desulfatitalea alkaliphila]
METACRNDRADPGAKPRLLITGAGGYLGYALCRSARRQWSVTALYRKPKPAVAGVCCIQADLTDLSGLEGLMRRLAPHAVVHAAAEARVGVCQKGPAAAEVINVQVPARLAELCEHYGIALTFTSTDLVFGGRQAPYDETAAPDPVCVYGAQKARAEDAVRTRCRQALVCRLPLLVGLAPPPHGQDHFTRQMVSAIVQGRPLHLFVDEFRTPVDIHSAARGLLALTGRARGLLHLGGRSRISRYELGLMVAERMALPAGAIRSVTIDEIPLPYQRAPDCSLDSRRAYALGYDPLPLPAAVDRMADDWRRTSSLKPAAP